MSVAYSNILSTILIVKISNHKSVPVDGGTNVGKVIAYIFIITRNSILSIKLLT